MVQITSSRQKKQILPDMASLLLTPLRNAITSLPSQDKRDAELEVLEILNSTLCKSDDVPGTVRLEADVKYIVGFHTIAIVIAAFGATITFPLIITTLDAPTDTSDVGVIRVLLATSWTLFIVAALVTCISAGNVYENQYVKAIRKANQDAESDNAFARRYSKARLFVAPNSRRVRIVEAAIADQFDSGRISADILLYTAWRFRKAHYELARGSLEKLHQITELKFFTGKEEINGGGSSGRGSGLHDSAGGDQAGSKKARENLTSEMEMEMEMAIRRAKYFIEVSEGYSNATKKAADVLEDMARDGAKKRSMWATLGLWDLKDISIVRSHQAILLVGGPIGGALICMSVVIFMYTKTVGIVAISIIGGLFAIMMTSNVISMLYELRRGRRRPREWDECEKGAPSLDYDDETTLLHRAAGDGDKDVVVSLVEEGGPGLIDAQDGHGQTALHRAAMTGKLDVVEFLVEKQPNLVDVKDKHGRTALHCAADNGHKDVVMSLVEKKPSLIAVKDEDGRTALHRAAMTGKLDVVEFLIEKQPNLVDVKDKHGWTALHRAADNGHKDVVMSLVEKGGPGLVDEKDNNGQTALHHATDSGKLDVIVWLVEKKPSLIAVKDEDGRTALHRAAMTGKLDVVEFLVEKQPNLVDVKDEDGRTALHLAARFGHKDVVAWLVEKGKANVNAKDNRRRTALHVARKEAADTLNVNRGGCGTVAQWLQVWEKESEKAKARVRGG